VAWNDDSQKLVFQLFDKGQAERTIVRELSDKYKSNDKTVRRCLAGLRLVKASLEGRQRSPTEEKRFELLGGTQHYLGELGRSYEAHKGPTLQNTGLDHDRHEEGLRGSLAVTGQLYHKSRKLERSRPSIKVTYEEANETLLFRVVNNGGNATFKANAELFDEDGDNRESWLMKWNLSDSEDVMIQKHGVRTIEIADQIIALTTDGLFISFHTPKHTPHYLYETDDSIIYRLIEDKLLRLEVSITSDPPLRRPYKSNWELFFDLADQEEDDPLIHLRAIKAK
jgi:hypothetical protein